MTMAGSLAIAVVPAHINANALNRYQGCFSFSAPVRSISQPSPPCQWHRDSLDGISEPSQRVSINKGELTMRLQSNYVPLGTLLAFALCACGAAVGGEPSEAQMTEAML